jgi:hypothetical protein
MQNVKAHALVSMALLASFIVPAAGQGGSIGSTIQLAQNTDSQKQYGEGLAAFNRGDDATALRLWTPLAEQGFAKAQEKLGVLYYEGRGVARDYGQALVWFRKAADQGDANAPFYLGVMYHDGLGVAKDHVAAVRWYRRAAAQGTAVAQLNLGAAYADGQGVARDHVEAVRWYRKAADQGHALAQNNLAWMYENGRGVAQDRGQALMWYRKAAEQGNTLARNNLSRLEAEPRTINQIKRTDEFINWCSTNGFYTKDSRGWSCAFTIGITGGLISSLGQGPGCEALKSKIDLSNEDNPGAQIVQPVFQWLGANPGKLTNNVNEDMKAAIGELYSCWCSVC